jgi:hypothetical protein
MAVLHAPDSPYAKERAKWEAVHSEVGAPGRPYVKRDYPMLLHRAGPPASGLGVPEIVETQLVESAREMESHRSRGFRPTPLEALESYAKQQFEFAELAAERNAEMLRAGDKAKAEVAAVESAAGMNHLPTIPETPIRPKAR